jgi:hypothetical protein
VRGYRLSVWGVALWLPAGAVATGRAQTIAHITRPRTGRGGQWEEERGGARPGRGPLKSSRRRRAAGPPLSRPIGAARGLSARFFASRRTLAGRPGPRTPQPLTRLGAQAPAGADRAGPDPEREGADGAGR